MNELHATAADRPATRLATRLAFLVAGFGIACWAPLVPFAKHSLAVDDRTLGLLLLCLGVGSVTTMLLTGAMLARHGSRPVIVASGLGLTLLLPVLPLAGSAASLGVVLFGFGAALGALDVAMNVHAVEVERSARRPLMSGFHALYSIGGFGGSTLMTALLSLHWSPAVATLACATLMAVAMAVAWPRLIRGGQSAGGPRFARPRGVVLVLSALAAVMFLAEGALLDWSAVLITDAGLVPVAQGGLGYMLFSIAMTAGRLGGDAVSARIGDRATMFRGGLLAMAGFAVVLCAPWAVLALTGFVLIGLGASNIVPVLFRRAGTQREMPAGLAVAAITTVGYAGVLVGPAGVGMVAKLAGLPFAFWMLALMIGAVPLCVRRVTAER